jgi:hypothetical protein
VCRDSLEKKQWLSLAVTTNLLKQLFLFLDEMVTRTRTRTPEPEPEPEPGPEPEPEPEPKPEPEPGP